MRLLTDENIPRIIVSQLRECGHDVLDIREAMSGISDVAILRKAEEQQRLLLTFDLDFGELGRVHTTGNRQLLRGFFARHGGKMPL
ncbi:MAG TPA: DUF5615 family PIN-like protein [Armatimonadota bacterium]|nr:DUF5615 family PIN-like protein [Armatimonadota bacterium]HOS42809.1 DUF5615 family PIN-like protein [Armatimonadota bacterium]